jgi:hypothetical protein
VKHRVGYIPDRAQRRFEGLSGLGDGLFHSSAPGHHPAVRVNGVYPHQDLATDL